MIVIVIYAIVVFSIDVVCGDGVPIMYASATGWWIDGGLSKKMKERRNGMSYSIEVVRAKVRNATFE